MMLDSGCFLLQLLDDALADNMVGQASEGLGADNIGYAGVNQLQHLTGQKPSFSGLVAKGNKFLCHIRQLPDPGRRGEVFALFQLLAGSLAEIFRREIPRLQSLAVERLAPR